MTVLQRLKPLYEVKQIVDGKSHFYTIGDDPTWHPGVTSALKMLDKPALVQWASNSACENIKEYLLANALGRPLTKEEIEKACLEGKNIYKKKAQFAADIGTRVHRAIDDIIHGNKTIITDDIKPGVDGFLSWMDEHKLKIELGDTKIGSRLFGFGGSLDFLASDGNDLVIFDNKTTKKRKDRDHGVYPEMCYQLAAYKKACEETFGVQVKAVYALWLNKEKPEFKAVKVLNENMCFEAFLATLKLYKLSKYEMMQEF